MKYKILVLILIIMIAIFVVWEVWPADIAVRTFGYDDENSPGLLDACIGSSGILSARWELTYPRQIELNSESTLKLRLIPDLTDGVDVSSMCSDVIIAANLEIPGAVIEPGEIVYTAFDEVQPLEISWSLIKNALEIDGKLWIYALPGGTHNLENQFPLFAIPIHIEVISYFGLEPRLLRIAGLAGVCFLLLFFALAHQYRSE